MPQLISAAESTRPALVLDVDGVFIINRDLEGMPDGYIEHPRFHWSAYNPSHGPWLNNIHQNSADIYYISDNQDASHWVIGQHLGLPEFDWIDSYAFMARSYRVRRSLAITALFGNRPLVWVDDCIGSTQLAWAKQRTKQNAPTLAVRVNEHKGLQTHHMKRIDKWLQQLTTES